MRKNPPEQHAFLRPQIPHHYMAHHPLHLLRSPHLNLRHHREVRGYGPVKGEIGRVYGCDGRAAEAVAGKA